MIELHHIYETDSGITSFDRYFSYLEQIEEELPRSLREFACDRNRYALQHESSMHDAWINELSLKKVYADNSVSTAVRLELLLATHRKALRIDYSDVISLKLSLEPNRWPDRPVDLLVHEFAKLGHRKFRHALVFDREVWIEVIFSDFSAE